MAIRQIGASDILESYMLDRLQERKTAPISIKLVKFPWHSMRHSARKIDSLNAPLNSQNKIIGLEALRFIFAFSVLIWHYQHFAFGLRTQIVFVMNNQPLYNIFGVFYNYGIYGVQVLVHKWIYILF
jgi:hypothetical protein